MAADVSHASDVDFSDLGRQLELQELESPSGIGQPQLYGQLLAVYLLENDLTNAKFLWKRIPQNIKTANADLALIWNVGQKMWQRDFPAIYESLNKEFPEYIKPLMTAILESTRKRAFTLVAKAYSYISTDDFSHFVGMPVNDAVDAAVKEGWKADSQTKMLTPAPLEKAVDLLLPSEEQLARLTDFVSFLEN